MPETDAQAALVFVERLRESIAATHIPFDGSRISVTASFGVCPLTDQYADVENWLAEADKALYRAKTSGRNRTILTHVQ